MKILIWHDPNWAANKKAVIEANNQQRNMNAHDTIGTRLAEAAARLFSRLSISDELPALCSF